MHVVCPVCERPLNVPEHMTGKQVRCPLCQAGFQAAAPAALPVARPAGSRSEPRPASPPDEEAPSRTDLLQREMQRGALRLMLAGIVFSTMGVSHVVINLVLQVMNPTLMSLLVVTILRTLITLYVVGGPALLLFLGAHLLRRVRGRGLVMTAAIVALVFACLYVLGVFYLVLRAVASESYGSNKVLVGILMLVEGLLLLGTAVLGFVCGCATIGLLGRPEVKQAYGVYVPPRPPREPWRRPRYEEEQRWRQGGNW
jgi:LSD1 subclass zinc finger protein